MNRLVKSLIVLAASVAFHLVAQASAEAQDIRIVERKLIGTGCPAGSFTVLPGAVGPTSQAILITFDNYRVDVEAGSPDATSNCIISLKHAAPRGIRIALASIRYDGYATLDQGTTGLLTARYNWRNASLTVSGNQRKELVGPYDDIYVFEDKVSAEQWSACASEEIFEINSQLLVTNDARSTANGSMRLDSSEINIDGQVRQPANAGEQIRLLFSRQSCTL